MVKMFSWTSRNNRTFRTRRKKNLRSQFGKLYVVGTGYKGFDGQPCVSAFNRRVQLRLLREGNIERFLARRPSNTHVLNGNRRQRPFSQGMLEVLIKSFTLAPRSLSFQTCLDCTVRGPPGKLLFLYLFVLFLVYFIFIFIFLYYCVFYFLSNPYKSINISIKYEVFTFLKWLLILLIY